MFSILRSWHGRTDRNRPRPTSPPRHRLGVEYLEDRSVPAVTGGSALGLTAEPAGTSWAEVVATGVAVDPAGNSYVAGTFYGRVDFDPSDPSDSTDTLSISTQGGSRHHSGFLAKYDANGAFLWVHRFGNAVYDVAADATGNVYAIGKFSSRADDATADDFGNISLTAKGPEDIFVARVATDGTVSWATRAGGYSEGGQDFGRGIALDAAGNPYICGAFGGTADFGATTLTSGSAYSAAFAAKLDAVDGSFVWAKGTRYVNGSGGAGEFAQAIAVDGAGRVSLTGHFYGNVDFDPGAGTTTLASARRRGGFDSADAFVWQLDGDGNFRWAQRFGGTGLDGGKDVAVDADGNVYSVGGFTDTVDFDPGKKKANLSGGGNYLLKLDSQGNFVWAVGGSAVRIGDHIDVDAAGNVYHAGSFSGTVDFAPGSATSTLTGAGGTDAFVAKLDSDGNLIWAVSAGGTGDDKTNGLAVAADGTLSVVGQFAGTVDFDPTEDEFLLTSPSNSMFLWNLTQD